MFMSFLTMAEIFPKVKNDLPPSPPLPHNNSRMVPAVVVYVPVPSVEQQIPCFVF